MTESRWDVHSPQVSSLVESPSPRDGVVFGGVEPLLPNCFSKVSPSARGDGSREVARFLRRCVPLSALLALSALKRPPLGNDRVSIY
jgi:hypothetical protein